MHCYKEYPLNTLCSHELPYLSPNYLLLDDSDEGSDTVNDYSSIEIPTSSENRQHDDNLQLQSENKKKSSLVVREEQQNSVRDINIYNEIDNIIQYCKEQDF